MPTFHQTCSVGAAALVALALGALPIGAEPASVSPSDKPGVKVALADDRPTAALLSPKILLGGATVTATGATTFRIIGMRTDAVIRLIADQHGLVPHISDRVRGTVSDVRLVGDVTAMMTTLAQTTDVNWFVYDGALEVVSKDETATRFVPLKGLAVDDAARVLREAGLDTARIGVRDIADGSAVRVSGPPKAAEVVEAVLALTKVKDTAPTQENMIVVRRGTVKVVETYGDAGVTQLNEDRKVGLQTPPIAQTNPEVTAATEVVDPPAE